MLINNPLTTHTPWVSEELENNEFPHMLINIMEFNNWRFRNYFFCPLDNRVYRLRFSYNTDDKEYPPVRLCINPNNNQIDMYDIHGRRHSININTIAKTMRTRFNL